MADSIWSSGSVARGAGQVDEVRVQAQIRRVDRRVGGACAERAQDGAEVRRCEVQSVASDDAGAVGARFVGQVACLEQAEHDEGVDFALEVGIARPPLGLIDLAVERDEVPDRAEDVGQVCERVDAGRGHGGNAGLFGPLRAAVAPDNAA